METGVLQDPAEQLAKLAELGHDLSEYTAVGSDIYNQLEEAVMELNKKFSNPEQKSSQFYLVTLALTKVS